MGAYNKKGIKMKKRVLIGLVLLAFVTAGAAFAQKAGETVQLSAQFYRNLRSTGNLTITMDPSRDTFTMNDGAKYIRANIQ